MSELLIEETRALLALFLRSNVRDLTVRTQDCSIFLAKSNGSVNPFMRAEGTAPVAAKPPASIVAAPQLGIFRSAHPVGATIAQGDQIGTIEVLDEARSIISDRAGCVLAVHVQAGTFVEYGEPLLSLG